MHGKRLGPSTAPSEVVVPLANLDGALSGIEGRVDLPMLMEGMVTTHPNSGEADDVTLLGFILHDERKFTFNFAFALALTVLKIAKENGGRAYATGLYFTNEADRVLGAERLRRLREFKAEVDPEGLFNPNKVLNGKVLLSALYEQRLGPLSHWSGSLATRPNRRSASGSRARAGGASLTTWPGTPTLAAQCGYCVDECDQYYGRGWESQTPRGKWYFLRQYMEGKVDWNQKMVDTILACTTCELCNVRCCEDLPIEPSWLKLRGQLIHDEDRMTFPPFEIMRQSLLKENNIWASYRVDRPNWMPAEVLGELPERAEIAYFPGCTASYVETRHRPGHGLPAAQVRRRVHLPGPRRGLLRHSHAGGRPVGYLGRDPAPQHRGHEGPRGQDGGHLLPGLLAGVAHLLSRVGRKAGH